MKRILLLAAVIFLCSTILSAGGPKVAIIIQGNYYTISDKNFKKEYEETRFFPEAKLNASIFGNFYLWGSYGSFPSSLNWTEWSNKGVIEADIDGERIVDKRIIAGGLGFFAGYIAENDFAVKVEAGVCSITNTLESTLTEIDSGAFVGSETEKQSGIGVRANLGVTYGLFKRLFSELSFSYMYASDKIDGTRIKLGGLQLSVGLGYRF